MSSTTTKTTIINRGLQILGYQAVQSINDNNRGSRAMNRAYYPVLYKTLRDNFWNFSIQRAVLAASTTKPAFGRLYYFNLPPAFLMLAMPDQHATYAFGGVSPQLGANYIYRDWQIEDNNGTTAIATNDPGPLKIRFVSKDLTESQFDPAFAEAFSANLALNTNEELTQSNSKLQAAAQMYKAAIDDAKKRNAFEQRPIKPPVDSYLLSRF